MRSTKQAQLKHLSTILGQDEILTPMSIDYEAETSTFASQRQKLPRLVIRPKSVESLSQALAFLATTNLELDVRSQGYGNASAADVLISMSRFDQFELDLENKCLILGAGQRWSQYYEKMQAEAPQWTVIACRTPCIGVGGSILHGGYSWLSGEHGCTSDPKNMLDAQVVKLNGEIVWASSEPELLWALRGGGGGWGVVAAFKLRIYPAPQEILCGPILIPRSSVSEIAKRVAAFDARSKDPRVSMFIYVMPEETLSHIIEGQNGDMLVVHAYDAHGLQHGRGEDGFAWALNLPGAIDMTKLMNLQEVANLQAGIENMKGHSRSLWHGTPLGTLTEDAVVNAFKWHEKVRAVGGSLSQSVWLLFELRSSSSAHIQRDDTAYPRNMDTRHIVLFGTGVDKDAPEDEFKLAEQLLLEGPRMAFGENAPKTVSANSIEHFHDMEIIYEGHYKKMQAIKRRYDPAYRLPGPISPFDGPKFGER